MEALTVAFLLVRFLTMARRGRTLLVLLLTAASAQADTIVLKSGRRITAASVMEEGDRVFYETAVGRLSVRKDQVERIERGGSGAGYSAADRAADLGIEGPKVEDQGGEDVVKATLREGNIDRAYLARLENESATSAQGARRVALAHHTAAQYEAQKGNMEGAAGHYRRALTFAPEHLGLLVSLSYLHLRRSEYTQALEYLERARRVDPDSADAAKLMGWAYYGANKIEQAVGEWKRAMRLRPDADTERALEKALRDKETESEFREGETRHFALRYNGSAAPQLAREILRVLEGHFGAIESALEYAPPDQIGVILYTRQEFMNVTRAPSWAGAMNDGRIRVPVQGLTSVTGELDLTLRHELVHSFIHQKGRGRAPIWLHEGVAQWMEGQRSGENAGALVVNYEQGQYLPMRAMEGAWTAMPPEVADYAYAWSLAIVEYMVQTSGMGDVARILDRLGTESGEGAVRSVLRLDYAQLEAETAKYLKKTYRPPTS